MSPKTASTDLGTFIVSQLHIVALVLLYYPFSIGLTFYQKWVLKVRRKI